MYAKILQPLEMHGFPVKVMMGTIYFLECILENTVQHTKRTFLHLYVEQTFMLNVMRNVYHYISF